MPCRQNYRGSATIIHSSSLFNLFPELVLLLDSEKLWHEAERWLIERHGHVVDETLQKTFTGMDTPTIIHTLKRAYRLEPDEATLADELRQRVEALLKDVEARVGAGELLAFLAERGIPRAVVSNSSRDMIEASLACQPWRELCADRFSADHVAHAKPAPDLYLYAAQKLGVRPNTCLVLEDSLTGVRAAVSAGMTCFAVPSEEGPDLAAFAALTPHIFEDLHEVRTWLEHAR